MHENMTLKSSSAMNGLKLFILGEWQKCEKTHSVHEPKRQGQVDISSEILHSCSFFFFWNSSEKFNMKNIKLSKYLDLYNFLFLKKLQYCYNKQIIYSLKSFYINI